MTSQSIWGATDKSPILGTYRFPVDTGPSSGPGYITGAELATFIGTGTPAGSNTQVQFNNSGAFAGDPTFTFVAGTLSTPAISITSSSTTALAVGPAGATNPMFQINAATASAATGIAITGAAAGSGSVLAAISSGSNEALSISSLGTGALNLNGGTGGAVNIRPSSTTRLGVFNNSFSFTPGAASSGATPAFGFTSPANTGLTAGTEVPIFNFNMNVTTQHASNTTIALQRDARFQRGTHSFVTAGGTITDYATVAIDGPGFAGTNATLTNSSALYIPAVALSGTITNSYGLNIFSASGASNNYAAQFTGAVVVNGAITGNSFAPTSSTVPANGIYLPAANKVGIAVNSVLGFQVTYETGTGTPVNSFQAVCCGTGFLPYLEAEGSDTNISSCYVTKGSGSHIFNTNGPRNAFADVTQFSITHTASSTQYISVTGSNGGAPVLTTTGGDLSIQSNSGNIQFGNSGSFTASGAVATVLGSIGPTGSHTTVQTWLTIKDSGGTVRYIPCF